MFDLRLCTIEVGPEDDPWLLGDLEVVSEESVDEPNGLIVLENFGFHGENEYWVEGEEMLKRAKGLGKCAGLRCARALLRQRDRISDTFRVRKVFLFPGTIVRGRLRHHHRYVPHLYWASDCGGWCLGWAFLVDQFGRKGRIVRLGDVNGTESLGLPGYPPCP